MTFTNNIKHPLTFSTYKGTTDLASEINAINQSIKLILTTAKGELFGDPNFGSNLYEFIYEYEGEPLYQLIREEIVTCLNQQEPRISITEDNIEITQEDVTVYINITYSLRNTDYQTTYVHSIQTNKEEV